MSDNHGTHDIYTWLGKQSLPVKILLGPPIVSFVLLYGCAAMLYVGGVLIPGCAISGFIRNRFFRRFMKKEGRVVEWRHVRSQLLANPDAALLVEIKGDDYGWCCPHANCEQLPRYDDFLAHGTSSFYASPRSDRLSLKRDAAVKCLQEGQVLLSVPYESIENDAQLPRDRVHVIYGSVQILAALVDDERDF